MNKEYVFHTPTYGAFLALMGFAKKQDWTWINGFDPLECAKQKFGSHEANTCIRFGGGGLVRGIKSFYEESPNHYVIVDWGEAKVMLNLQEVKDRPDYHYTNFGGYGVFVVYDRRILKIGCQEIPFWKFDSWMDSISRNIARGETGKFRVDDDLGLGYPAYFDFDNETFECIKEEIALSSIVEIHKLIHQYDQDTELFDFEDKNQTKEALGKELVSKFFEQLRKKEEPAQERYVSDVVYEFYQFMCNQNDDTKREK